MGFWTGFKMGFREAFFRHRPPHLSERDFAIGAGLFWALVLSLFVALLWPGLAAAQVAGVCGAGRDCTVRRLTAEHSRAGGSTCMNAGNHGYMWASPSTSIFELRRMFPWVYPDTCSTGFTGGTTMMRLNVNTTEVVFPSGPVHSSQQVGATLGFASGANYVGTPFASFPACTAGLTGRLLYDSTNNIWRTCNGATWLAMTPVVSTGGQYLLHGVWTAAATQAVSAAPEGAHFLGAFRPRSAPASPPPRADVITCQWQTAGTGGSTGVVVEVWNQTDGTQVCSCVVGACTATARDPLTCGCEQNLLADKTYTMRLTSGTDCTANPQGVVCSVNLVPGF